MRVNVVRVAELYGGPLRLVAFGTVRGDSRPKLDSGARLVYSSGPGEYSRSRSVSPT